MTPHSLFAESEAETGVKAELSEETGIVEEDLVAVSYMGDELDLETVGDIIAIIEDKVLRDYVYCHHQQHRTYLLCSLVTIHDICSFHNFSVIWYECCPTSCVLVCVCKKIFWKVSMQLHLVLLVCESLYL